MKLVEQVRLAQGGDPEAQSALYTAMYKRVYYLALRMTGSPEDAEDAAQETFLSAFRALPQLSEPNAFEGWLFQIAANKCRNVLRKEGKYTQLPEDEDGRTMLDELPEEDEALIPASALDNSDHRAIILSIIESLPQQQRECVLLFYYSQLSVKQIAQALDCSEGTVKSRLNYARQKLREGILATEERDGIRLHALVPIGLLFLKDFQLTTAGMTVAALGTAGAAGAAAQSSGGAAAGAAAQGTGAAAAAGAAKAGLLTTLKAKIIAGATAAALLAGVGTVLLNQPPKATALAFSDPAMEANVRVLVGKEEGELYPEDVEGLYSLYVMDGGVATESADLAPVPQPLVGTTPVDSLTDLALLPNLQFLYFSSGDTTLLDTLGELPQLDTLNVNGEGVILSNVSFVEGLSGLRRFSAPVEGGADLGPLETCGTLWELTLFSQGGIALDASGLEQLTWLTLIANQNGMQPQCANALTLTSPLPQLSLLHLSGGQLPTLDFLSQLPALQGLDLYGENLGDLDLSPLAGLSQLRCVSLNVSYDDVLDLAPLADCPALEVYLAPNGTVVNPPPQAVTDTDSSLPLYNGVMWEIQDDLFDRYEEGYHEDSPA